MDVGEKKVLLLIVEGSSDKTALESSFNDYLEASKLNNAFVCAAYHSDFTTHAYKDPDNLMKDPYDVVSNIKDCINSFLSSRDNTNKYKLKDIVLVASLSDLDCCYCRKEDVIIGDIPSGIERKTYVDFDNKKYICTDTCFINNRNYIKTESLGILSSERVIVVKNKRIPYFAFYCSINLEHSLYNNFGYYSEDEKNAMAEEFRLKARKDVSFFEKAIDDMPRLGNDYNGSWEEKELYKRPFDRLSNLKYLLDMVISTYAKKDKKE